MYIRQKTFQTILSIFFFFFRSLTGPLFDSKMMPDGLLHFPGLIRKSV